MQVPVCVYNSICTVLRVAYVTYASVQIYYKLESTLQLCKLRGGRIHQYKLPLCKTLGLKWGGGMGGGGAFTPGWAYTPNFTVLVDKLSLSAVLNSILPHCSNPAFVAHCIW